MMAKKIIFITGGVLSSLGKGISAASIGVLLKKSGFDLSMLKIDPYINVDPGTMSPIEHGEVFVTADGAETDLDLGNYERFLDMAMTKTNNFTTGQVYKRVIEKERKGEYLGETIQVIPHIVDEIKKRILKAGSGADILIVELGGTVGDIESMPYLEAIRSLEVEMNGKGHHVFNIHVTLIPFIKTSHEFKTKPTQHSVQELRKTGINPTMIICRSEKVLPLEIKKKIATSCGVYLDAVISAKDASTIYQVPLDLLKQDILLPLQKHLYLKHSMPQMEDWRVLVKRISYPKDEVRLAFVGKYITLKESYKSLTEAFTHAGAHLDVCVNIQWFDSEEIGDQNLSMLKSCDGVLVAGGFGSRGVQGKIKAIRFAREHNMPYLGICLGMQLAVIEFAQNVLGISGANSLEFDEVAKEPIIYLINQFIDTYGKSQIRTTKSPKGGTMRLGSFDCIAKEGSILRRAYGQDLIQERHRHRYELNPAYRQQLEDKGMIISGEWDNLIEAIELKKHKWFVGVQFHPEFSSNLERPNPIIYDFVKTLCQ